MLCCGVIHRLELFGACCPCLESEESHAIRTADYALQSVPVRWIRMVRTQVPNKSPPARAVGGASLFDGVCCGDDDADESAVAAPRAGVGGQKERRAQPPPPVHVPIDAALSLVDTPHGPALRIEASTIAFFDDRETDDDDDAARGSASQVSDTVKMSKTIALKEIGEVGAGDETEWERLGFRSASSRGTGGLKGTGLLVHSSRGRKRCMLVLEVAEGGPLSRDDVVRHINSLVGWELSRVVKRINNLLGWDWTGVEALREDGKKKDKDNGKDGDIYQRMEDKDSEMVAVAVVKEDCKKGERDDIDGVYRQMEDKDNGEAAAVGEDCKKKEEGNSRDREECQETKDEDNAMPVGVLS